MSANISLSRKKYSLRAIIFSMMVAGCAGLAAFVYAQDVPTNVTPEDRRFIGRILEESGYSLPSLARAESFNQQIAVIRAVQDAVLRATPVAGGIPRGTPREPKNLYYSNHALCFDRSRTIGKTLRLLGYDVHYTFILSTKETGSAILSLLTPGVRSHAVVEARTAQGWLIVDSVKQWISLNANGNPVSLSEWQDIKDKHNYKWSSTNKETIYPVLDGGFTFVYGLYSRHGDFYPPYTFFPDIDWRGFIRNL